MTHWATGTWMSPSPTSQISQAFRMMRSRYQGCQAYKPRFCLILVLAYLSYTIREKANVNGNKYYCIRGFPSMYNKIASRSNALAEWLVTILLRLGATQKSETTLSGMLFSKQKITIIEALSHLFRVGLRCSIFLLKVAHDELIKKKDEVPNISKEHNTRSSVLSPFP